MSQTNFSPSVLSVLPLFYIGWNDSVLSPSELKTIHKVLDKMTFLTPDELRYLKEHSRPGKPPSMDTFRLWKESLQEYAQSLSKGRLKDLAELGVEIAKASSGPSSEIDFRSEPVMESIKKLQEVLGVDTLENLRDMTFTLGVGYDAMKTESASFSSSEMSFILDGEYAEVKRRCRRLLSDEAFQYDRNSSKDVQRSNVKRMLLHLADQGYGGLAFPTKYDGQDNMRDYMEVFHTLATHDLSLTVKFGVQFGLFGGAVYGLGTERHHKQYVDDLSKCNLLGCFAMTETGHGSNVKDLETTATYNDKDRTLTIHSPTLTSGKEYIGNALHGSMAAVFCQLIINGESKGIHAVLVPYRDANGNTLRGITVKDNGYKLGLNGVDNGRLWFDQVVVPVDNLLDKYGGINEKGEYFSPFKNPNKRFFSMLGALVGGRVCVGYAANAAAETALTIATKYAMKRRQFAPASGVQETLIMDYPTHQHRLIPLIAKTYAFRLAIRNVADAYVVASHDEIRKIETKAAGLKAMATWHATHAIQTCREACGGKGYLAENRFAELKADSDIFTTFEGDNTVLLQLVAKGLLTEYRQSFHDDGFVAVARYLGRMISNTYQEINPYTSRNTDTNHLRSEEFHEDALKYREKKLLTTLASRMQTFIKKKMSPNEAFLKCQMHMVTLAKAYTDRLVYRELSKVIDTVVESKEKEMLGRLRKLYALTVIQENKDYYLESGYFEGSKTKAIRRVYNKMLQELRPEVLALVDSFAIGKYSTRANIIDDNTNASVEKPVT